MREIKRLLNAEMIFKNNQSIDLEDWLEEKLNTN